MPELNTLNLLNDSTLTSYYRFEGNSNDVKTTNNGTDASMTYGSAHPKYSQYASFSSSTISLGSTLGDVQTTGTITFWLYPTASGKVPSGGDMTGIMSKGNTYWCIGFLNTNLIRVGGSGDVDSATALTLNTWSMVTVTWTASGTKIYINGVLDTNSGTTTLSSVTVASNGSTLMLGRNQGFASSSYAGDMDDLAFFTRELTATDVRRLYMGSEFFGGMI